MKKIMTLVCAGIMALSLAACGSKGGDKVLTVGCVELAGTFSPLYSTTVYDGYVVDLVYEKLLNYDVNNKLQPALAEKYEISKDGKEITFNLTKDAVFSDGTPLTAEDVEFTFKAIADPSYTGRYSSVVSNLVGYKDYNKKGNKTEPEFAGIKVVDEHTVKFTVTDVRSDNLSNIAATVGIISKNQFKDTYKYGNTKPIEDQIQKPMGSGPYVLKEWKKGTGASFTKNPEFKGEGYKIENVIIKPVDQATQYEEIESGNINLLPNMAGPKVVGPASNNEKLAFNEFNGSSIAYMAFNTENGATADKTVRQALAYAFNRQSINDSYFECKDCKIKSESLVYTPTTFNNPISPMSDVVTGKTKLEGLQTYDYNLETAKKMLDDAGWKVGSDGIRAKDGQKLSIKYLASQDSGYVDSTVNVLNKDWKKELGVDLQIASVDFNTIVDKITHDASKDEWNIYSMGNSFTSDTMSDIMTMTASQYVGDGKDNYARLKDPKLDGIMDKGVKELDEKKALEFWKQANIQLNEDAAYIPTYGNNIYDIYAKNIKNLKTSALHLWPAALKDATIE